MTASKKAQTMTPESLVKNVQGTFAAEGMILNQSCLDSLSRIAYGKVSSQQVLRELKAKYERRAR